MLRRGLIVLVACALTSAGAAPAQAQDDLVGVCSPPAPVAITPTLFINGPPAPIELRVLVALDGITVEQADDVMKRAADAYAPLGIQLTVARYVAVRLTSDVIEDALDEARHQLGGKRPPWAHLVVTITRRALTPAQGLAACIGGIRFDDQAFAIGEYIPPGTGAGVLESRPDNAARLVAHELGHLAGAEHHHAYCGEGSLTEPLGPCTLMFPQVPHITSMRFGVLEASVIRGYVEQFAKPLPPVPPLDPEPAAQPAPPVPTSAPTAPVVVKRTSPGCRRALRALRRARHAHNRRRTRAARRAVRRSC